MIFSMQRNREFAHMPAKNIFLLFGCLACKQSVIAEGASTLDFFRQLVISRFLIRQFRFVVYEIVHVSPNPL